MKIYSHKYREEIKQRIENIEIALEFDMLASARANVAYLIDIFDNIEKDMYPCGKEQVRKFEDNFSAFTLIKQFFFDKKK